jgi:hypothetical protein
MKRICVAGQKDGNARREAQLDVESSSKPSNAAGALFGRNPNGRRGFLRIPLSLAACLESLNGAARSAACIRNRTVAIFVSLC